MVLLSNPKWRKFLRISDKNIVSVLWECFYNVKRGHVEVPIYNLEQYENVLATVLRKNVSVEKKSHITHNNRFRFSSAHFSFFFTSILVNRKKRRKWQEEFILVRKKFCIKTQPYQTQVLEDPGVKNNLAKLTIINKMRSSEHNESQINEKLSEQDSGVDVIDKNGVRN